MDRSLGGPLSRSGRYGVEKNLAPAGNRALTGQLAIPAGGLRLETGEVCVTPEVVSLTNSKELSTTREATSC
jgi:hypothetical protein